MLGFGCGRMESLLNRLSCSPDDPNGHGTERNSNQTEVVGACRAMF